MIVIDASVLVITLIDNSELGNNIRKEISESDLYAPELIDLEIASVLRKLIRLKNIPVERADQAIKDLRRIKLNRVPHIELIPRCWELRYNITPYDAAYISLAEILDCELYTSDKKLAKAPGKKCAVKLV